MEHQKELDQWLTRMHQVKWNNLSPAERLSLLQDLENIMAKSQGREPMQVKTFRADNTNKRFITFGQCTDDGIYINEKFVENRKRPAFFADYYSVAAAINTILHEGRHAWQKHMYREGADHVDETTRAKLFINFHCYMPGGDPRYSAQFIELDARRYARQQYDRMMDRMKALGWNPELVYYTQKELDRSFEANFAANMKRTLSYKELDLLDRMITKEFKDKIKDLYPNADGSLDLFGEAKKFLRGDMTINEYIDGKKLAFSDADQIGVSGKMDAVPSLEDAFWKALGAPIDRGKEKEKPDDLKVRPIGVGKKL